MYADIPLPEREAAAKAAVQRLYGEGSGYTTLLSESGFEVDSIALWYTPTEDKALSTWCQVATFDLQ